MARIKTLRRLSVVFSALTAFAITSDQTSWRAATQLFNAALSRESLQVGFALTLADYSILIRSLIIAVGTGLAVSFILKTLHIIQRQGTHDLAESLDKLRAPRATSDAAPAFTVSRIADAHLGGMTESYAATGIKNAHASKRRTPPPVKVSLGRGLDSFSTLDNDSSAADQPAQVAARR